MTSSTPEIVFALFPGVTQLDFTAPHQAFSRWPGARVRQGSVAGGAIEADGIVFDRLEKLSEVERCDVLCVPGGGGVADAMQDERLLAELRRLAGVAQYVTSVCTGSLLLGAAGLLRGRRAACHWAWRQLLPPFGAIVDEGRVVRDGNLLTGGGITAGIDLALTVVDLMAGATVAQAVQLTLEYAPQPPFDAGRPESAPSEVLALVRQRTDAFIAPRREAVERAARRLDAAAG